MINGNINTISLIDIVPDSLRDNPDIIAISEALDKQFSDNFDRLDYLSLYGNLENQTREDVIDYYAKELDVDFYDETLSFESKRNLVLRSYDTKKVKGSAKAVTNVLEDAYSNASVIEWFDYAGSPFFFKVNMIDDITLSIPSANLLDVVKAIESVKNARSRLEEIFISTFFTEKTKNNSNYTIQKSKFNFIGPSYVLGPNEFAGVDKVETEVIND